MSSRSWIRLSGLGAMLGGALWGGGLALFALGFGRLPAASLSLLVALLLILFSVGGLYLRQAVRQRRLGAIGLAAAVLGFALSLVAGVVGVGALRIDAAWSIVVLGLYLTLAAAILAGFAAVEAGVIPAAAAPLLIIGGVGTLFLNFEDARAWLGVPFGVAWAWLGAALWSPQGAEVQAARG